MGDEKGGDEHGGRRLLLCVTIKQAVANDKGAN